MRRWIDTYRYFILETTIFCTREKMIIGKCFHQKKENIYIYIEIENLIFSVSELLQFHHLHPPLLDASISDMQSVQFWQESSRMHTH